MRRILIFLLLSFTIGSTALQAQVADTTQPFYKRFPTITPFQILLSDSTTLYGKSSLPKNRNTAFIVFSPDCSHCQQEAESIVAAKEQLRDIQILMITMHPLAAMKEFISKYGLDRLENVIVGRDLYYQMPAYYGFHSLPFHALYDRKGNLVTAVEGSMPVESIIAAFQGK